MKITAIFEKINDRLFAVRLDTENEDELDKAFSLWRQADYLREFFVKYRADLMTTQRLFTWIFDMRVKRTTKPKVFQNAVPSYDWKKRPDYKKENRGWIRKSINVAIRILDVLEEKQMTQSDLAEKLGVSRQQVSKILKGRENLTLETISKIEAALGIKLGAVLDI